MTGQRRAIRNFWPGAAAGVVAIMGLLAPCVSGAADGGTNKPVIEERPAKVIETGLVPCCSSRSHSATPVGEWLSDDLLLLNALQDVPDADEKALEKLVVFDLRTQKVRTLLETDRFTCRNSELNVLGIGGWYRKDPHYFVGISEHGDIKELGVQPALDVFTCRPMDYLERAFGIPGYKSDGLYLKGSDGFIPITPPGKKNDVHGMLNNKAVLLRPNAPSIELPFRRHEINGSGPARYIAFLDRYQLNWWDSQYDSCCNRRMGGEPWKALPYDFSPFRLLFRDGRVEEIPYPEGILKDYGIRRFNEAFVTRLGLVIDSVSGPPNKNERGLFLIQDGRPIAVWGRPAPLAKHYAMAGTVLSPDGCKLAFRRFSDWRPGNPKHVTILDLCNGG